jgi:hypothetical protein
MTREILLKQSLTRDIQIIRNLYLSFSRIDEKRVSLIQNVAGSGWTTHAAQLRAIIVGLTWNWSLVDKRANVKGLKIRRNANGSSMYHREFALVG